MREEKLVDLINQKQVWGIDQNQPRKRDILLLENEELADHLVANGVTVQEWISVKERLPDLIPCSAGTAYSEAVNVLTSGRKVFTAIWDGAEFIGDAEFWEAEDEEITHWTPVLLPLPKSPTGE